MSKLTLAVTTLLTACAAAAYPAVSASSILARVKAAEASLVDYKADMFITEASKKTISGMGEGYSDIMKLEKATISYKKPDKMRYDGYTSGMKVTYIQNGYTKLVLASMVRYKSDVKNAPGKRQDTLDLGFLSSRLWSDNIVTTVSTDKQGIVKLKFDPKYGGNDKRHDFVWVDPKTLKMIKREKYRGSGELRISMVYKAYASLTKGLPIATVLTMHDPDGNLLGTVTYKAIKPNVRLSDSIFSLSSRK